MPEETPPAETGPKVIGGFGLTQDDIDSLYGPDSPLASKYDTEAIHAKLTERLAAQVAIPKTTTEGQRVFDNGGFVFGLSPDPVGPEDTDAAAEFSGKQSSDAPGLAAPAQEAPAPVVTPVTPLTAGVLGEVTPAQAEPTEAH